MGRQLRRSDHPTHVTLCHRLGALLLGDVGVCESIHSHSCRILERTSHLLTLVDHPRPDVSDIEPPVDEENTGRVVAARLRLFARVAQQCNDGYMLSRVAYTFAGAF